MDIRELKNSLEVITKLFDRIVEPEIRAAIAILLNIVESLSQENEQNRKTIQNLRDEVNRLKGEQGKPNIKPQKKGGSDDHSSEGERKKRQIKNKNNRNSKIVRV